jgi:hypothetical protein
MASLDKQRSRRRALALLGLSAAGAMVAACGGAPRAAPATSVAKSSDSVRPAAPPAPIAPVAGGQGARPTLWPYRGGLLGESVNKLIKE